MANPFEKFLDFRKSGFGLWQKKVNQVIGLDIGNSSVKVVQLRKDKGQAILETYGEIALGPYRGLAVGQAAVLPTDKLTEVIRDLFREANITTTAASFAVPLGSSLVVTIELPKVEEALLAKVVPIESRKYIPVPISEVALDWWVIPKQQLGSNVADDKLEVLVVAIHNSLINQYQEVSTALSLETAFFEIETFSAIRAVLGNELQPTAILDFGAATTKMAIVDYGIIRVAHTINKGSQDITAAVSRSLNVEFGKAEEIKRQVGLVGHLVSDETGQENLAPTISNIVEYIFLEANKVINGYQQKSRRAVSRVIIIGGGSLLRGLLDLAQKNFDVPVSMGTPFDKVEAPAFLQEILSQAGPGFAVAIGLGLRHLQTLD